MIDDADHAPHEVVAHRAVVIGYRTGVTVVETVLALAVIPTAIYGLIVLITMWPRLTRPRYRAGQKWDFAPVLWVANPAGVNNAAPMADVESEGAPEGARPSTARGGARGNW
ncbi:hypothetical protein ABT324_32215 [Saccharopolyspora sp. NPDC000359]|uniref:aa3-type cytochrome oxidase subunit CtaJ n=1 Tax=Saccharopolyspora sp. NPDC000359 TaxID=3154251 RepID=UPI00332FF5BC